MGIYPFAQTDMVATFMDGISPEYVGLTGFVEEQIDWIIQHFSNQVKGALSPNTYINFMDQNGTKQIQCCWRVHRLSW